ncbi:MAG: type II toxin-antitoxin system MqsA family antitoxin [Verrucomicrobiales bacterium]|nr:type II toxin-antitoxin system MqsA family antitoxin [Verrucomicrobiales bacterium]
MKNKSKAKDPIPCFDCEDGFLLPTLRDYPTKLKDYGEVVISNVPMECCDQCGTLVTGSEGDAFIRAAIDRITNSITPEEVHHFLQKYQLTQKTASEITGYGEKNISRWLTGKVRPSDSVSNFLRLLIADEDAFSKLKSKNFGERVTQNFPDEEKQPDKDEKEIISLIDYPKLVKLKAVAEARSPQVKRTELCRFFQTSDLASFGSEMSRVCDSIAAFKDTEQKSNPVSGGVWITLGTMAANKIKVVPYHQDKLEKAVDDLREYTQHEPEDVIEQVQSILAQAGVALVFLPLMKQSALRGCTRLLNPTKAMIIHSLKYRTLSQFWLILFHEIAHLILHINTPEDVFPEYAEASDDPRELEADEWARDTLVYSDKLLEFSSRHPKPKIWELQRFSEDIKVHPSIVAEVFNQKKGEEVISYSYLRMKNLFPNILNDQAETLWRKTAQHF